jgi:GNAT superfamily N-acetyltransferase
MQGNVRYSTDIVPSVEDFISVLSRSGLGERRPIGDAACVERMVAGADLFVCAFQGEILVGVARSVTDFAYCCYLSDLAVDAEFQGKGIGKELVRRTHAATGPRCKVILLSAPNAAGYYSHIGFSSHPAAFVLA